MNKETMKNNLKSLESRGKTVGYHLDTHRDILNELVARLPTSEQDSGRRDLVKMYLNDLQEIPNLKDGDVIEAAHINTLRDALVVLFNAMLWQDLRS